MNINLTPEQERIVKDELKAGHFRSAEEVIAQSKQYWDVWLVTRKQRLAAFTVLLMLALGIISRGANSQPYLHNESTSSRIFVGPDGTDIYEQSHLHSEPSWLNSFSRGIQVDSGAAASVNTGTDGLRLLATLGIDINVVTNDAIGNALF